MQNKTKIIYTGLEIDTLFLLSKESSFFIGGVSLIPNLFERTLNPVNQLCKLLYRLRYKGTHPIAEYILLHLWKVTSFLATSVWSKYADYLIFICRNKIQVVDTYDPDSGEIIRKSGYDLMVVNAWGILPHTVFTAPLQGTINIHPSKLPQYRGALPTLWSLKNRDTSSAVTYIVLTEKQDEGMVLKQHDFEIQSDDTWISLEKKISKVIEDTLIPTIRGYLSGQITPYMQDTTQATYTARYDAHKEIDFSNESAIDIYNKVHLYPYIEPGTYCYFMCKGKKVTVRSCIYISDADSENHKTTPLRLIFKTKDGTILLRLYADLFLNDSLIFLKKLLRNQ